MLIVRSPVRVSFAGGGTDMPSYFEQYGGAVVSAAINKYFYTVLQKRTDGRIQVISSDLRACETWQNISRMSLQGTELEIPLAVLKELGADVSVDLFMSSEIPPGTGLGSSAAVCVNVLKTFSTYLNRGLSQLEIAEEAYRIARSVLRRPIGKQDEFAATFGGINCFRFGQNGSVEVDRLSLESAVLTRLQHNLMLFFTGAAHNSWTILKDQEEATSTQASAAIGALHRIKQLAGYTRDALMAGDLVAFGEILDEGWHQKRQVSSRISNRHIDQLYDLAKLNGAVGGKITGAGGGGFLLLYCEPENQKRLRTAFASVGLREMAFDFDFHGAHVVANDPFMGDGRTGVRKWTFVPYGPTGPSLSASKAAGGKS